MKKMIRLGSRGSPLALLQTEEVRKRIFECHPDLHETAEIEIVPIRTSGDWRPGYQELSFRDVGGSKELFTKEIEEALIGNHIDMAVHSMKDLSSRLPAGLTIAAVLDRIDPRDGFIGREAKTLDDLPQGAVIGTSSLRRQAQLLARRPDLTIVPFRGNVETRLKKLADGKADATLLAMAGLVRLGMQDCASSIMEPAIMLPAAAQGAIGVQIREDDAAMAQLLACVNHAKSFICISAERALLKKLDGSCHTPIGALAEFVAGDDSLIELSALAARPNGKDVVAMSMQGPKSAAEELGIALGEKMRANLPADFFAY